MIMRKEHLQTIYLRPHYYHLHKKVNDSVKAMKEAGPDDIVVSLKKPCEFRWAIYKPDWRR